MSKPIKKIQKRYQFVIILTLNLIFIVLIFLYNQYSSISKSILKTSNLNTSINKNFVLPGIPSLISLGLQKTGSSSTSIAILKLPEIANNYLHSTQLYQKPKCINLSKNYHNMNPNLFFFPRYFRINISNNFI